MDVKDIVRDTYDAIVKQYFDEYYDELGDAVYYDKFITLVKNGTVLDLGCGNGKISRYFEEHGLKTIGYDISPKMIDFGKSINPGLEMYCHDITQIPKQATKVDGAIYAYSLFNLNKKQAEQSLKSLCKNMKKGGYVLLFLQKGSGEQMMPEPLCPQKQMYVKFYDEAEITNLLSECGFKVLEIDLLQEDDSEALSEAIMIVMAQRI